MTFGRSMLGGLCATALLCTSAEVAAASPSTVEPTGVTANAKNDTSIRFLNFDSIRGYGSDTTVRGQVVATVGGSQGAVAGVRVKLYRKINGTTGWHRLDTAHTTNSGHPRFHFVAKSVANARYRVRFDGNSSLQPSRNSTPVSVYRHFGARLEDRTGSFHGRVTPHYAHRTISLGKRKCGTCSWTQVRSHRTGDRGKFRFTVGAPRHGRWFWRVSTPATKKFIRSYSGVFTTQLG